MDGASEEGVEAYQTRLLEEGELDDEYVAHVEPAGLTQPVPDPLEVARTLATSLPIEEPYIPEAPTVVAALSGHLEAQAEDVPLAADDDESSTMLDEDEPVDPVDEDDESAVEDDDPADVPFAAIAGDDIVADAAEGIERFNPADDGDATFSSSSDGDEADEDRVLPTLAGGGWTIPLLCMGIAIIGFCMIIPQADANRRLAYERSSLRADLESIQTQVATNDEFLRKLATDPTLAERLAQRQLNLQRAGTRALSIGTKQTGTSPFDLVKVTPPAPMKPYEPLGGKVAAVCRDSRSRLRLMGVGLFIMAAGLILGAAPTSRRLP